MDRKWWTLLATCVATFMLLLDITIVNVALPEIQRDLDASFSDLQWVVDAYSLMLAAFLLTTGVLGDRIGRKKVFVAGFAVFIVASLACGLAHTPTSLNVARAVQGLGGAAMFATTLALIAQEFEGPQRATAFGIWGATVGGAVAIGPLVGGALTEGLGWEWIFFVNIPIGLAAIALTVLRVAESQDRDAERVDVPGTILFSAALFALIFGLVRGNPEGWDSTLIELTLGGSVVALIAFLFVERRSDHPMMDLSLFKRPAFIGVSAVALCLSAGMFAMFLYITIYLQDILEYEPLAAGVRFLPLSLVSFFAAPLSGRLLPRFPTRVFFGVGLGLVGTGLLLMHGVSADSGWTTLLAGFIVAGAGVGITNPAIATTAVGVVSAAKAGMGSGINSTFRQVGIATGIAALGAVFQSSIDSRLPENAPDGAAEAIASSGTSAVPPESVDVARDAFIGAFNEILLIAAIIVFAGAALGALLTRESDITPPGPPPQPAE